ncbi:MAG: fibronectin type III domain-containing protein [bacterium]|nr:fibronectin type III domain-containing protein [bacterium]
MKNIVCLVLAICLGLLIYTPAKAAGGIYASGGTTKTAGQNFTINVTASGASFNAFQGKISVSGPVSIVSFGAGSATWVRQPSNGAQFIGMTTSTQTSLRIATITLKGTQAGSGSVSVSGVQLASNGSVVGSGAGGTSFTILRAPVMPGPVTVTSSSHPDQTISYDISTIVLSWEKGSGVTGFAYLLDQVADTTPPQQVTSADTTATYPDQNLGTYYFHIRAQNGDGWGPATHFKIGVKAKLDKSLAKPYKITITKAVKFTNNVKDGTVTGLVIRGITKPGYIANINITPLPTIPEGKSLSVVSDKKTGQFRLLIDFPIASGFHLLTVQAQKDKILTPISDEVRFEIEQRNGGSIVILSDKDAKKTVVAQKTLLQKYGRDAILVGGTALILLVIYFLVRLIRRPRGQKNEKKKPSFQW